MPPNDRTTKTWTAIAWPTNIQSGTPDGKFGPAKQMDDWGDCWFLAPLAAVANDPEGHKILAESITKVNGGYDVTFKGLPNNKSYISDSELDKCLDESGGDADTRLMELAADKFFRENSKFKSLYFTVVKSDGLNQDQAERCLQDFCRAEGIQDPMTHNPMRDGSPPCVGFFMFTGRYPDESIADSDTTLQSNDVMRYLNTYVTDDRDGASVTFTAIENPLGNSSDSIDLVIDWDVIRTEITYDERLRKQEKSFLNALDQWLATGSLKDLLTLMSASGKLKLEYSNPVEFVNALAQNLFDMSRDHANLLQSAVREVLAGGLGYIGFPGSHVGNIEGINEAMNTFTYSEPTNPTVVHTGELSHLIQAIISKSVFLSAPKPTTGQDEAESSHAGEQRGRHLLEIHQQAVRDGTIDPVESGPLANLMEMDDGTFRQVYDSDKNGMIAGGELKAVQLRVDRWVDHLKSTPIW